MQDDLTAHTFDDVARIEKSKPPIIESRSRPVRIEEVARLAGVSPITVSRALRSPELVSKATRSRILKIVEETGYWSNPHASALRSGRSSIVAVFVSNLSSQQYTQAAQACTRIVEDHGLQIMVGQTSYSYSRELTAIQSLRALRPAAVFFTGVIELEENRQMLRDLAIPIVESWAYPRDPLDMLVGFSNVDAGRLAASHLIERGFQRPAFIGRSGGRGGLRLKGFCERLARHDITLAGQMVVEWVEGIEDGRAAYRRLQDGGVRFDSVFCANDILGMGALVEALSQGQRVPDDVAILTFGDRSTSGSFSPRLSMICVDTRDIGIRAAKMILSRLSNSATPDCICLDLSLIVGETT